MTATFALAVEPDTVTDVGETAHVVFTGPPPHASDTVPVKPFTPATVSRYDVFRPYTWEAGDADNLKSTTFTVRGDDVLGPYSPLPS